MAQAQNFVNIFLKKTQKKEHFKAPFCKFSNAVEISE